ncbi:MAG: ABC transporter ATP-binding protein [Planctomycetota bacterium]
MLQIESLTKTYPGPINAMADVTMQLTPGLFGLLGPNGAGKTTLMRTLATLQLPDSGSARLDDIDLVREPHRARQLIGYLPQEMGVYPRVTAREMLEYLAGLKGIKGRSERRMHVVAQLEKVNLGDVADQRLDTYSGGMRQRFGIAAALLGNPRLVIVDEPTAGLDPSERRRFQLLLTESAKHCILLLSSHIVEDISGLCDAMALMHQGHIIASGHPDDLVDTLTGKVWQFETELEALGDCQRAHRVLSWQPRRGRLVVRVFSDDPPLIGDDASSVRVDATLEDFYAFQIQAQA